MTCARRYDGMAKRSGENDQTVLALERGIRGCVIPFLLLSTALCLVTRLFDRSVFNTNTDTFLDNIISSSAALKEEKSNQYFSFCHESYPSDRKQRLNVFVSAKVIPSSIEFDYYMKLRVNFYYFLSNLSQDIHIPPLNLIFVTILWTVK